MTLSTMLTLMAEGMGRTFALFALTLIGSLPLGMIVALLRNNKIAPVRWIIRIYISIIRGTPLMLQLLVWYFGPIFTMQRFGISMPNWRFPSLVLGFVVNYAAYFAEIYRGGIESISIGQYEAAKLLGYSKGQSFIKIILPQVIKRIIPSVTNEVITLVKDTSLAFVISVVEMFTTAKAIAAAQTTMAPFIAAGIFYYVFNFIVAVGMEKVEKKLNYFN